MLTKEQMDKYKTVLEQESAKLQKEIEGLTKVPELGSEIDSLDTEADEAEEFSQNQGAAVALKQRLNEMNEALGRISTGTYGTCAQCAGPISQELLDVNPESLHCQTCNKAA